MQLVHEVHALAGPQVDRHVARGFAIRAPVRGPEELQLQLQAMNPWRQDLELCTEPRPAMSNLGLNQLVCKDAFVALLGRKRREASLMTQS